MCKICEDNRENVEYKLFKPTIHMGFAGDIDVSVYMDPYNKQLAMTIFNPECATNMLEYYCPINFCPMCGRELGRELNSVTE